MKTMTLVTITIMFLLSGCAPKQPVINIPPEPIYEYKHQIIDTSEVCRPNMEELSAHLNKYSELMGADVTVEITEKANSKPVTAAQITAETLGTQPTTYFVDVKEIEAIRAILLCVQTNLETELDKYTADGWEVTYIQPLESGIYEMGIEYVFITILRKEK